MRFEALFGPGHPGPVDNESRTRKNERRSGGREAHVGARKCTALRYCVPLAVFGGSFLFLIITVYRIVNQYDESLILVGSTRVLSGDIPYRDFYANYGPAQFYVLAALFKVFGPSVLVERKMTKTTK
jgi:hypothetical protein